MSESLTIKRSDFNSRVWVVTHSKVILGRFRSRLEAESFVKDRSVRSIQDPRVPRPRCSECGRVFDILDPVDAAEWRFGHDCE